MLRHRSIRSIRRLGVTCAFAGLLAGVLPGCSHDKRAGVKIQPRYTVLPAKQVPAYLKDTILERCDLTNTEPFLVSGYSVVVNLNGTGDSVAPNRVREYIINEMVKHKWGSSLSGIPMPSPEQALRDPRVAIVQVDGYLPAGARAGQRFDVQVSALPESNTTSLAGGDLFQTDLRVFGADPSDPGGAVNNFAQAEGPLFVNPAYALTSGAVDNPSAKQSLRFGVVMDGAVVIHDRPLGLRLRSPSLRLSRYIEDRIDARFQEIKPDTIAAAQDEAIINVYVPPRYHGDWVHFSNVMTHMFLNGSPEFSAAKARQLADEAVKPDAPLLDISYCWEALGKVSLPVIQERHLMTSKNQAVAFAAARAAAFLGDPAAPQALVNMARMTGHQFQINAIEVLGEMTNSPAINELIRPLLNSPENLVRIEAFKMLAKNKDSLIFETPIKSGFLLDVVPSSGPPVIYASRLGTPRIALIGGRTNIKLPVTYTALDGRLSISSNASNTDVTIFYRPEMPPGGLQTQEGIEQLNPIKVISQPDIASVIARLGGEGFEYARGFSFNYGQIVSILNNMAEQKELAAVTNGSVATASFMLQELPQATDSIYAAPVIRDNARPASDTPDKVGMAK